ncbi:MAG: hypothetical protein ABIE03_00930 [Patescibacteria group bacterium]|nr:hypothetical protein [Patescibacteria group bacterium]
MTQLILFDTNPNYARETQKLLEKRGHIVTIYVGNKASLGSIIEETVRAGLWDPDTIFLVDDMLDIQRWDSGAFARKVIAKIRTEGYLSVGIRAAQIPDFGDRCVFKWNPNDLANAISELSLGVREKETISTSPEGE